MKTTANERRAAETKNEQIAAARASLARLATLIDRVDTGPSDWSAAASATHIATEIEAILTDNGEDCWPTYAPKS